MTTTDSATATTRAPARRRARTPIVDADIHPVVTADRLAAALPEPWRRRLHRFGLRGAPPPAVYPRVRHGGMRRDAHPDAAGGPARPPGSDLDLMRSQLLDPYDVVAGVLIPMQGHTAGAEEPAFAAALCRAYNDVLVTDWLDPEPRLRASICIPHESPAEAVAEIERRAADPRFVQVLFPSGTFLPWSDPKYRPIYAAAAAHGLPVAIHLGGTEGHRGDGWPSFYLEQHAWYGNAVAVALTGLVAGGVLDAVPDLQLVLVEGGVSWLPSLLWGLDDAWELCRDDVPWLTRPPSEIVRERVWFTTQPIDEPPVPAHLATTWEQTGMTDRILFSSDYPHWDFDDPITALRVLPAALRRPMAAANAARLYGLTLPGSEG